jgi:chloramphenicol O-acetyltransferase type A
MKHIDIDSYLRKDIYLAFRDCEMPHLSVTADIDITNIKAIVDEKSYGFFLPMAYLAVITANRIPAFRQRIVAGELVEFEECLPSFTVTVKEGLFSFCDVQFLGLFTEFYEHGKQLISDVKKKPNLATTDKHARFFITNIPWISFTAFTHPYCKQYSSVPIISFGKFRLVNGVISLPVAVQANHALVDGYHLGQFFEILTKLCDDPATVLGI